MPKTNLKTFDYKRTAEADANMWRAYYNHQFFKLFGQLFQLSRARMGLRWLATLRIAYYAGWAAAYYRINKKRGVDNTKVLKNLTKFYKIISDNCTEPFDYAKAAQSELAWWDIHRKSTKNNAALENSLAENAAVIYHVSPAALKEYAHYRAEAMILPRHEGDDQPVPTDWQQVHHLLELSWHSLHKAVQKVA